MEGILNALPSCIQFNSLESKNNEQQEEPIFDQVHSFQI